MTNFDKVTISFKSVPTFRDGDRKIDLNAAKDKLVVLDKDGRQKTIEGFKSESGTFFRLKQKGGQFQIVAYGTPEQLAKSNMKVRSGDVTKARFDNRRYDPVNAFKPQNFEIKSDDLSKADGFAEKFNLRLRKEGQEYVRDNGIKKDEKSEDKSKNGEGGGKGPVDNPPGQGGALQPDVNKVEKNQISDNESEQEINKKKEPDTNDQNAHQISSLGAPQGTPSIQERIDGDENAENINKEEGRVGDESIKLSSDQGDSQSVELQDETFNFFSRMFDPVKDAGAKGTGKDPAENNKSKENVDKEGELTSQNPPPEPQQAHVEEPAADPDLTPLLLEPLPTSPSSSSVPEVIIPEEVIDAARRSHVLQPPDFSFNNYNKGLPEGVCNGASVVWLNEMAQGGVQRVSGIDTDPVLGEKLLNLQLKFETSELNTENMKKKGELLASQFELFDGNRVHITKDFAADVKTTEKAEFKNIEMLAKSVGEKLRSAGDFAFIQISGKENGHASAIFRDPNDIVHFFDPDKGAYSFKFDAAGLATLGAKLNDLMNPKRNDLTLVFGTMLGAPQETDDEISEQIAQTDGPKHPERAAVDQDQGAGSESQASGGEGNVLNQPANVQLGPEGELRGVEPGKPAEVTGRVAQDPQPGLAVLRTVAGAVSALLTEEPLNAEQLASLAQLSGKDAAEIAALQDIFIADPEKKALPKLRETCVSLIESAYEKLMPKDAAGMNDERETIALLSKLFSSDKSSQSERRIDLSDIEKNIGKKIIEKSDKQLQIQIIQANIKSQERELKTFTSERAYAAGELRRAQDRMAEDKGLLKDLDETISGLEESVARAYESANKDQERLQELDEKLKTDVKSNREIANDLDNIESAEELETYSTEIKNELSEVLESLDKLVQGDDLESEDGSDALKGLHEIIYEGIRRSGIQDIEESPLDYIENLNKLRGNLENLIEMNRAQLREIESGYESDYLDEDEGSQRVPDEGRDFYRQVIAYAESASSLVLQEIRVQTGILEIGDARKRAADALDDAQYSVESTRLQRQFAADDSRNSAQAYNLETDEAQRLKELESERNELIGQIMLAENNLRELDTELKQMDRQIASIEGDMKNAQKRINEESQNIVKIDEELDGLAQKKDRIEGVLRGLDQDNDRRVGEMILMMRNRTETLANP